MKKFDVYLERLSKSTASRGPLNFEVKSHFFIPVFDRGWIIRILKNLRKFRFSTKIKLDYPQDLLANFTYLEALVFTTLHSSNLSGLINLINEEKFHDILIDFENQKIDEFYINNIKKYTCARVSGIQRFIIDRGYVPELTYNRIKSDGIKLDKCLVAGVNYAKCFSRGDSFIEGFELDIPCPDVRWIDQKVAYIVLGSNQRVNRELIELFYQSSAKFDIIEILLHPLIRLSELNNSLTSIKYNLKTDRKWFYQNCEVFSAPTTLLLSLDGIAQKIHLITDGIDDCFLEEFNKTEILKLIKK